ncbi:MAG: hypothetical protein U9N36_07375 [Euryarchaeota archaeon]|nr:hypothetical protein [Euryarchaeota archaeon]
MECRELCHDRHMGLLLADSMRSIGAVKPNVVGCDVQAPYLSVGYSNLRRLT